MATLARIRLVAVIVVLTVPAVLFPLVGPWTLLWLPIAVMLLGVVLARPALLTAIVDLVTGKGADGEQKRDGEMDVRGSGDDLRDRSDQGDEPAPIEVPRGQSGTRGVRTRRTELPSAVDDYAFEFSALVHWRWAHRVDLSLRNPAGPAVHSIVLRAREYLRDVHPAERAVAESELESVFAVEDPVAGGTIQVWAENVRLELADEDDERLQHMARLRKDRALWAAEHEAARTRAAMSGDPGGPGAAPEPAPGPPLPLQVYEAPGAHEVPDMREAPETAVPMPGSGVDEEGYESYWWPAEQDDEEGAVEQDVQVAILRGLIDSVEDEDERAAFVREQVEILERSGFPDVAERIQSVYPER
ncbi:hypothetical protein [Nocardiopsis ganjiahuensis]|uniref:hypothetical protein n=1 Tax=Nocardiopsis ganjiahuensis TaxID=239984 RepID=UPI0003484811|nr:hypothetical protein [Nocardiopsis ganjiahuensis]